MEWHQAVRIPENASPGTKVVTLKRSETRLKKIKYNLNNHKDVFHINQNSELILDTQLDFETTKSYELTISSDLNYFTLMVEVDDVNDNEPQFLVPESPNMKFTAILNQTKKIFQLKAVDRDSGKNGLVRYQWQDPSLAEHIFHLNPSNGDIYLATSDVRFVGSHQVVVMARDQNRDCVMTSQIGMTIEIQELSSSTSSGFEFLLFLLLFLFGTVCYLIQKFRKSDKKEEQIKIRKKNSKNYKKEKITTPSGKNRIKNLGKYPIKVPTLHQQSASDMTSQSISVDVEDTQEGMFQKKFRMSTLV